METNDIIVNEAENGIQQDQSHDCIQNDKPDLFDRTMKGLEMANKSADTSLRVFSTISDHAAKKDAEFVAEYRSPTTKQRKAIIADAVKKNEIPRMQGYKELSEIQKQEEAETLNLLQARANMKKASGTKGLKIGAGIGIGGGGIGLLILAIVKAVGKKAA